jgi:hypothetical protein
MNAGELRSNTPDFVRYDYRAALKRRAMPFLQQRTVRRMATDVSYIGRHPVAYC